MTTAVCQQCGQQHTAGPWCEHAQALHGAAVEAAIRPGATMAPSAPVVLEGPPAPPNLLPSGARAKHTPVPYLGPDPMPSRRYGLAVQIVTAAAATVAAAQSYTFYTRMKVDQQIVRGEVLTTDTWESKGTLLAAVGGLRSLLVVAAVICGFLWRRSRRPKDARVHYGEAFVELPLTWIVPAWLRFAPAVLISVGVMASVTAVPADPTLITFQDQVELDRASAIGTAAWALAWATLACWPLVSERTHLLRRAWSGWYRERPGSVPFVAPVADRPTSIGQPAGLGWVLRTAGLVLLAMVGVIGTVSAAASLGSDPGPAAIALVLLLPLDIVLIQTFARRWRSRSPAPSPAGTPEVPTGTVTWF